MKRFLCLMFSLLVTLSLFSVCAFAADESSFSQQDIQDSGTVRSMVVFGDSISAGFGSEGYDPNDSSKAKDSFPNLLAAKYGLTYGENYFNFSHTGDDSSDVLSSVMYADKEILKQAEIVIFSVGANDILDIMERSVYDAFLNNKADIEAADIRIDFSSLTAIENTILSLWNDPEKKEIADRLIDTCTDTANQNAYQDAVLECEANIKEMISYLREVGCQAEIYFIAPYNPTAVITGNKLSDMLQKTLENLRDRIVDVCHSQEFGHSVTAIDLLTEFDGQYFEMTNIASLDIHPTKSGHQLIADKIAETNEINLKERIAEQNTIRHRTAPYNNTIVYIIFGFACVAVIAIIVHFLITHRKK